MFTIFIKDPCNPDCDCQKENKKKECKCQQKNLLEIPLRNF
jgi:hypothetical protein